MVKPSHFGGYSDAYTVDCERVLVTLLRGLGPWKESVFLVGGLTPRYLVPQRPPDVPAHAGTLDVDIVIDLQLLADTDAYHSLEDNLKRMGVGLHEFGTGLKVNFSGTTNDGNPPEKPKDREVEFSKTCGLSGDRRVKSR